MHKYLKNKWFVGGAVIVIIAGFLWIRAARKPQAELVKVTKGTVVQEVTVTGTIEPAEELSLSFEKSGKVARVYHEVGDRVGQGETIVALSSADLAAQLASAEASRVAAEAKLDDLKLGTRPEELAIKQTS